MVSLGGSSDLQNVIAIVTTGAYAFAAVQGRMTPIDCRRWIFLQYNLELIPATKDRWTLCSVSPSKKEPSSSGCSSTSCGSDVTDS